MLTLTIIINGKNFKDHEMEAVRTGRRIDFAALPPAIARKLGATFNREIAPTQPLYFAEKPINVSSEDQLLLSRRQNFAASLETNGFEVVSVEVNYKNARLRRKDRGDGVAVNHRAVTRSFLARLSELLARQTETEIICLLGVDEGILSFLLPRILLGRTVVFCSSKTKNPPQEIFFLPLEEILPACLIPQKFDHLDRTLK